MLSIERPWRTVAGLRPVARNWRSAFCCCSGVALRSERICCTIASFERAAASLMKVAGPSTTLVAPRSAICRQTSAAYWPLASGRPARQVSSPSSRSMFDVSISFWRSPSTRTTIASSPKRSWNSFVLSNAGEPLSTSLSVPASGVSRSAPTTATIATTETTAAIVAAGWVTDHSPTRPSTRRTDSRLSGLTVEGANTRARAVGV